MIDLSALKPARRSGVVVGDCREVLARLPENTFDACVTDPPYGLGFMGKDWDHEVPGVHFWQEHLRVMKPGAHLLAFGGTRKFHRLMVAIEDAGFELRDTMAWTYGTGFPKSLDVAKAVEAFLLTGGSSPKDLADAVDATGQGVPLVAVRGMKWNPEDGTKQGMSRHAPGGWEPTLQAAAAWDDWGTSLKPAWEPIVIARKPLDGTVAENVLKWGTGGINVGACRVGSSGGTRGAAAGPNTTGILGDGLNGPRGVPVDGLGRWPANLLHDGSAEVTAQFPTSPGARAPVTGDEPSASTTGIFNPAKRAPNDRPMENPASASRFFWCPKASKSDRDEGLEDFETVSAADMVGRKEGSAGMGSPRAGAGCTSGSKNAHPTVKPTALMRYLCRLVTPPGGTVLDGFAGSCSTGKAAVREGFQAFMVEKAPEHARVGDARMVDAERRWRDGE